MADLKVWGILPGGTTREQIVLDYTATGNDTDGYDIIISKKPNDEKEYDLSTLNWGDTGCSTWRNMGDATCISIANWDLIGSTVEPGIIDCDHMYEYSDADAMTEGLGNVTKNATYMAGMFKDCWYLTKFIGFNTKSADDMWNMFVGCTALKEICELDLTSCSKSTSVYSMFDGCNALEKAKFTNVGNVVKDSLISQLNALPKLSNITMSFKKDVELLPAAFRNNTHLTECHLSGTENVTDMNFMFNGCSSLEELSEFDTSKVTNMTSMFQSCSSLATVPEFNTQNATNMSAMFGSCTSLTTVPEFNTSNATNMSYMFTGCTSLTTVPEFDTSNVTDMNNMFRSCTSLTTVPEFDTQKVNSINYMFYKCSSLTTVPELDTSNVNSMSFMFENCTSLVDVPQFDTSNVVSMTYMFSKCNDSILSETSRENILKMCIYSNVPNKQLKTEIFGDTSIDVSRWNTLPSYNDFVNAGWSLD